jgi:hypothetical protein
VGHRAGLDAVQKRKILTLPEIESGTSRLKPVVIPTELFSLQANILYGILISFTFLNHKISRTKLLSKLQLELPDSLNFKLRGYHRS